MPKSTVSFVKSTYDDLYQNLGRSIKLTGGLAIPKKGLVVIKINLCGPRLPGSATITHPLFLDGLLHFLRDNYSGLEICVVEADATSSQPDLFIEWFGFNQVLSRWNAKYINLSKQAFNTKKINGRFFKEITVPRIFDENPFFITAPKLKTNLASKITCCLKNQFGCLPETRKSKYHKRLDDVIIDSNLAMKPNFCIVDAVIAMGGALGPGLGTPVPLNGLICGKDPVAIDAFCARLVGFPAWQVGHIHKAARAGIGSMNYTVVGDVVPDVSFEVDKVRLNMLKFGSWLQKRNKKN